jgi:hypothetical protein
MSINEILEKIKPFYTLFLLIVVGSIFFALGRLSKLEEGREPIKIVYPNSNQSSSVVLASSSSTPAQSKTTQSVPQVLDQKVARSIIFHGAEL